MSSNKALPRAIALLAAATLGALFIACPDREALIEITPAGIEQIRSACFEHCEPDTGCCRLPDGGAAVFPKTEPISINFRLVLVDTTEYANGGLPKSALRDHSKCIPMAFPCTLADGGGPRRCFAESINSALEDELGSGIGFDGLKHPDDVSLFMSLHDPDSGAGCTKDNFFGCAALGQHAAETYDIACASCLGSHSTDGPAESCLRSPCFARVCYDVLAKNPELSGP